ncbi:MAG: PSD1 and planctomycete cytochrome C domain-containing protein [Planctomycetaceae bacterium]
MCARSADRCIRSYVTVALSLFLSSAALRADDIQFNRDIRPILSENCFACHGPDAKQRQAELRLDVRSEAMDHDVLAPGNPEESEFVQRIFSDDPDKQMPPPDSRKSLTAQQKELLKQWVAEGAKYQGHWAYERPQRPEVPPGVHPVDFLVQRQLQKRGLDFSPAADRRTLARRLSFDLIGLPPSSAEVAAFEADQSPDAFDRQVDRLLSAPHYGERMAIAWLDVARFADTIGYHSDNPRNVWPYRDYVIRAFNDNMPFDRFTIEQLAGDLLEGSTQEQQVASCFNRLLLTTEEGGAQAKDYEARMMTDRVRAVGTVWLGQTLGCCQCHDHKFDPATSRDFYSLGAFFADIQEPIIGDPGPGMLVPDKDQAIELAKRRATAVDLQSQYDATPDSLVAAQNEWEQTAREALAAHAQWAALHPESATSEKKLTPGVEADESIFVGANPEGGTDTTTVTIKTTLSGITGLRIDVLPEKRLPSQGPGRAANGNFVLSEVSVAKADGAAIAITRATATFEQPGFPASAATDGNAETGNGWAIGGAAGQQHTLYLELAEPLGDGTALPLAITLKQNHGDNHVLGRFRISGTTQPLPLQLPTTGAPPVEIANLLRRGPEKLDADQRAKLLAHFKSVTPLLSDLRGQLAAANKAVSDYEGTIPRCLSSVAMGTPRVVRFLPRGNWMDDSGPVMQPAVPAFLATAVPDTGAPPRQTRLDLARWVVSRGNPLTARVFVNRLWKQFFGTALSKNTDDLGSQGEWPVQPELLDWLAVEFMDSGWDVKHMVRTIVTSRAYQQVSTASPELLAADPDNRWLARQSRYRLDAELVRDNALAVSGLLVRTIGGPSTKPYQPAGYWENLNFPVREYDADKGANQYRRGLYTWWQRTFPHPSMIAFDAPSREECAADRTRANIPQQAAVLLNDPTYVEAARAGDTDSGGRRRQLRPAATSTPGSPGPGSRRHARPAAMSCNSLAHLRQAPRGVRCRSGRRRGTV